MNVFIDVETFSGADIKKGGAYPYTEAPDFEIILVGYAINKGPIVVFERDDQQSWIDFLGTCKRAEKLIAHNATFERLAFRAHGFDVPSERWVCTMVKAAYCGLPMSLSQAGEALNLTTQKDKGGAALIRYFCIPCKPTKTNEGRTRNRPEHDPEKWEAFKDYLRDDVGTTRELFYALEPYKFTETENYIIDQKINDRGVRLELDLIKNAVELDKISSHELTVEARKLTGLTNPNSPAQLQKWINARTGGNIQDLKAETVKNLLVSASGEVKRALELRQQMSNTSVKKYAAAQNYACKDGRARGLLQFGGAGRTFRWAGRGIQLQNMPRNYMKTLSEARALLLEGDTEALVFLYEDLQDVLKQLTRTMLAPKPGHKFLIADYSAIEARVIAWLAGETWRLDVFNTHGKIYEASAALMFGVPFESVTKGSEYRQKGKIAELALGYQGGVNALLSMGAEAMGLKEEELQPIVSAWRRANPNIKKYWHDVEKAAVLAMKNPLKRVSRCGVTFQYDNKVLLCFLPSGRPLMYQSPQLRPGKFGEQIAYLGVDQYSRKWARLSTYGGKLTENIVQAVARDLLAFSMLNAERAGFEIVLHVHDEIVVEQPSENVEAKYKELLKVITKKPDWAAGLPLAADGFISDFYLKD
jgi:DNA polymerase